MLVRLTGEGEVKGKLTPRVVAAWEWRVNSLVDINHISWNMRIASASHRNDGIPADRNIEQGLNTTLFKITANPYIDSPSP